MIVVVAEYKAGKLAKSTYEMVTAARECGVDGPVAVLLIGKDVNALTAEAAALADTVQVINTPEVAQYDAEVWAAAVAFAAQSVSANTVIAAGSRSGREYSARAAVKLEAALLEDVVSLKVMDGALTAEHYTFLTRVTERIASAAPMAVVTVKPGAFAKAEPKGAEGSVDVLNAQLPASRLKTQPEEAQSSGRISLAEAATVVAGGRGVGSPEGFAQTVEALADALGGAVGATRAVVDAGWRPYSEQVGQTGKTVQPKLYVAVGISGAVQHLSGMNKSGTVVAINKDKDAPIFKVADVGIAGDVQQIVPAVLAELRK